MAIEKLEARLGREGIRFIPAGKIEILPLDQYVERFTNRYRNEKSFRRTVHSYLKISRGNLLKLRLKEIFLRKAYEKETDELLRKYAEETRAKLEEAARVKQAMEELQRREYEMRIKANQIFKTEQECLKAEQEYNATTNAAEDEKKRVEEECKRNLEEERIRLEEEKEKIKAKTDAKAIVQKHLENYIQTIDVIKKNDNGELEFDDEKMSKRLEDLFLDEIIEGIERDDGAGFFASVKQSYEGTISSFDQIENPSELSDADWIETMLNARSSGRRFPEYHDIVVAKYQTRGRASIDTLIMLDRSGSGRHNNRFEVERKTALATRALMRKLNTSNESFLYVFNDEVQETSSAEIMNLEPDGGTATDKALETILERLKGRGPSIAYLVTDGKPEGPKNDKGDIIERCIEAAKKFREHTYIRLRIFLVDGDQETEDITRKIGLASGIDTKVIPVKNYNLPNGMLKDISEVIYGMYAIESF